MDVIYFLLYKVLLAENKKNETHNFMVICHADLKLESGAKPERSRRRDKESKQHTTGKLGRCQDNDLKPEYLP